MSAKKILSLRKLLGSVVKNTKNPNPKESEALREDKQMKDLLAHLLGRQPTNEEISLAKQY